MTGRKMHHLHHVGDKSSKRVVVPIQQHVASSNLIPIDPQMWRDGKV